MTYFDFQDPMKVHTLFFTTTFFVPSFIENQENVDMVFIESIDSISRDGPDTP